MLYFFQFGFHSFYKILIALIAWISRKTTIPKANVVVDDRNIVGIDIGKRKHAAAAITPKGAIIASVNAFENNKEGVDLLEREVLVPANCRGKPLVALEATVIAGDSFVLMASFSAMRFRFWIAFSRSLKAFSANRSFRRSGN